MLPDSTYKYTHIWERFCTKSRQTSVYRKNTVFTSSTTDDMYNQILPCSRQEHILPETNAATDKWPWQWQWLQQIYGHLYRVTVHQLLQEAEVEKKGRVPADARGAAGAEIYLLSFSESPLTSGLSTFGYVSSSLAGVRSAILLTTFDHKVPETPCRQAMSMEPCNLVPPQGLECRGKPVDKDDLARHVGVCEDFKDGVKFYD